jgi:hypothetical protein
MRAFPAALLAVAGATLCTNALAHDPTGIHTPHVLAPSTTTGAASSAPALQAPIGHRQPRAADAPSSETNGPAVSPYDQQIDRDLNICRGC